MTVEVMRPGFAGWAESQGRRRATWVAVQADLAGALGVVRYLIGGSLLSAVGLYLATMVFLLGPHVLAARDPARFARLIRPRRGVWLTRVAALATGFAYALDLIPVRYLPLLAAADELVVLGIAIALLPTAIRLHRSLRASGASRASAARQVLVAVLPEQLVAVARLEFGVWRSAARWLRPRPVPSFSYGSFERLLLWSLLMLSLVEGTVFEVILRDTSLQWLRWLSLVGHAYALPMVLGLIAQTRFYPHSIDGDVLVLRDRHKSSLRIPLSTIASLDHSYCPAKHGLSLSSDTIMFSTGGATDIILRLREPLASPVGTASVVRLSLDDPRKFASAMAECLRSK